MSVVEFLKNIYAKYNNSQVINSEKKHPNRKSQDEFLSALNESADYYQNSYNKYKCMAFYHYGKMVLFLYNFAAFLLYFPMYFRFSKKSSKEHNLPKREKLLVLKKGKTIGVDDIFPDELKDNYTIEEFYNNYSEIYLDNIAKEILREARSKHPFSFYYNLVLMIRIASQCKIINEYQPEVVCTYVCEREFADPILTLYSEKNGVEYHGFMHGDFMYQIDHAFMQLSCYWIWDKHYQRMFEELKCHQQMKVYTPGKYRSIIDEQCDLSECEYYATYYFSGETKDAIDNLKEIFDLLKQHGKKCKLRPHPRFSNYDYINRAFAEYKIEDCSKCTLKESLEATFYCIAINSTVLSQAYHSGKKVVIDDLSNIDEYRLLEDEEYIMLDKADCLLSELLQQEGINWSRR